MQLCGIEKGNTLCHLSKLVCISIGAFWDICEWSLRQESLHISSKPHPFRDLSLCMHVEGG